jgi:hypothetical protein
LAAVQAGKRIERPSPAPAILDQRGPCYPAPIQRREAAMDDTYGLIWWSELMTRDPDRARGFHAELAGWTISAMPADGRDYQVAHRDGRPVAGIMDMNDLPGMEGIPPCTGSPMSRWPTWTLRLPRPAVRAVG